jgi:hypothetical protein
VLFSVRHGNHSRSMRVFTQSVRVVGLRNLRSPAHWRGPDDTADHTIGYAHFKKHSRWIQSSDFGGVPACLGCSSVREPGELAHPAAPKPLYAV